MRNNRFPPAGPNGHKTAPRPVDREVRAADDAVDNAVGFDPQRQTEQGQTEPVQMPESDPFELLLRQFGELRGYFSYYLSAKADSAKLVLWNALFGITLAALAFIVLASLSIAATWFVLSGAAEGLGILFGNRPWAANLATGLLLATGLGSGMYGIVIKFKRIAREGTVAKFENQQSRQQLRYGHNVADRAAANGSEQN